MVSLISYDERARAPPLGGLRSAARDVGDARYFAPSARENRGFMSVVAVAATQPHQSAALEPHGDPFGRRAGPLVSFQFVNVNPNAAAPAVGGRGHTAGHRCALFFSSTNTVLLSAISDKNKETRGPKPSGPIIPSDTWRRVVVAQWARFRSAATKGEQL